MSHQWIDTQQNLDLLVSNLKSLEWVVIDTEADSFHHFHEKLCLLQILTPQGVSLVDPLADLDLADFWSALGNCHWRIHAADYDLRLIRKIGGQIPRQIFDTFIGAQILGKKGLSYSALVLEYAAVALSKSNQKADWTLRPIGESMLEYAAADVLYIDRIVEALKTELEQKGRMDWFHQSCERQLKTVRNAVDEVDPDAWQISGHHHLPPQMRALLKSIWQWRQREAEQRDLAPFRVLRNDVILLLLERVQKDPQADFPVPPFIKGESKQKLLKAIAEGMESEPIPFIPPKRPDPMSLAVERRFNQLREKRQKVAEELAMDPGFIASKTILIQLAEDPIQGAEKLLKEDRSCAWQLALLKL